MSNITRSNSEATALLESNSISIPQDNNRFCGHSIASYDENLIRRVNNACCICFEDFLKKDNIALTKCLHVFHIKCITDFLKKQQLCPLCREEITCFTKYASKKSLVNNEAIICDNAICISKTNKLKTQNNQLITQNTTNSTFHKIIAVCIAFFFLILVIGVFSFLIFILIFNQNNDFNTFNNSTTKINFTN